MALSLTNIVLIFLSCSAIFQIIGLFTPGWRVMEDSHSKIESGLFFSKLCVNGKCHTPSNVKPSPQDEIIKECKALTITALTLDAVSIAILFLQKRLQIKYVAMVLTVTSFISGLLVAIAIGKFSKKIMHGAEVIQQSTGSHPFKFSYSLLLSGIGGAVAIVSSVVMAIHIHRKYYRNSYEIAKITLPELRFRDEISSQRLEEEANHDSDRRDYVVVTNDKQVLVI